MTVAPAPVVLSWSGGKDSAMALRALQAAPAYEVVGLLTTVSQELDRVVMQGVRRELVERQAAALGLPLHVVRLPARPSNEVYEARMAAAFDAWKTEGVRHLAFGDLHLEDIRRYRTAQLEQAGMRGVFPLWTVPAATRPFMEEMLACGYRAIVVCLDPQRVPREMLGRVVDEAFLDDLPQNVDPAGENGEFHTFVTDGPGFAHPVEVAPGEVVMRDSFLYRDVTPAGATGTATARER